MSAITINVDTSLTNIPTINIGKQGENKATQVVFDVSEMIDTYGSGTAVVVVQRRGDLHPYELDNTSQSGDKVTWTVSNTDTAVYGTGRVQLFWTINDEIAKTVTYAFFVEEALSDPTDAPYVPDGGWISEKIGDLDSLTTTDKDNLVEAINEVDGNTDTNATNITANATAIGTLANLTTTEKSNLVGAINEVNEDVSDVKEDLKLKADLPTETIENASIASFTDGAEDVPVKELKVSIEPIQSGSGDPSPTNVRPISGRESVTVTRTGANLFGGILEQGSFSDNGEESATTSRIRTDYVVVPEGAVTLSTPTSNVYVHEVYGYDKNKVFTSKLSSGISAPSGTITIPSGTKYIRFSPRYVNNGTITPEGIQAQAEAGSTATTYEPYNGDSYPIPLSSTIYGGTLEVETGVLTVTHGFIESYNGETLPSTWISDRDVYAEGTTPTTGAEVVYALATPTTVQLTPTQVTTLLKDNNIFADSGDVKKLIYRADLGAYIEKLINA